MAWTFRLPALHLYHFIIDVDVKMGDHPAPHFTHGHPVPHRHGPCPHEAFPSGRKNAPLDWPARGIRPVQHPDRLAMLGSGFQHIAQGGDERVYPATEIL